MAATRTPTESQQSSKEIFEENSTHFMNCNACDFEDVTIEELREHIEDEHQQHLRQCGVCKEFVPRFVLPWHWALWHPDHPDLCDECGAYYEEDKAMRRHKKQLH